MKSHFDAYGHLGKSSISNTMKSGRYSFQSEAEKLILPDVELKLQLTADCSLLDIGCGTGTLVIPLSRLVKKAVGVDHPDLIEAAQKRAMDSNIDFVCGSFMEVDIHEKFDRIVIYSVVQCLPDLDFATSFLDRAVSLLAAGGRLLIGDLSNANRKTRFSDSAAGKAFKAEWERRVGNSAEPHLASFVGTKYLSNVNDDFILGILSRYRKKGFHTYLAEQNPNLPFGHTREDIIIVRP